ncbi:hypothetical protein ACFWGI_06580 [Streptomyces niveus]|uniref:hypothetical protein n=1 Tax=Streptomyces niveus TaxID=193462 RepID=UPI0036621BA6
MIPLRRRIAFGVLALGSRRPIVTGRSVTRTENGITVLTVAGGTKARTIPVLAAYAPMMHALAGRQLRSDDVTLRVRQTWPVMASASGRMALCP